MQGTCWSVFEQHTSIILSTAQQLFGFYFIWFPYTSFFFQACSRKLTQKPSLLMGSMYAGGVRDTNRGEYALRDGEGEFLHTFNSKILTELGL